MQVWIIRLAVRHHPRGHSRAEPGVGAVCPDAPCTCSCGSCKGNCAAALFAGVLREAERTPEGTVIGCVRPEQVPHDEPVEGRDAAPSIILFQMDVIHGLTLSEIHSDAVTTAYRPLADFRTIVRGNASS